MRGRGEGRLGDLVQRLGAGEDPEEVLDVPLGRCLVQGHAHRPVVKVSQVDLDLRCAVSDLGDVVHRVHLFSRLEHGICQCVQRRKDGPSDLDSVEEEAGVDVVARFREAFRQEESGRVDPLGDGLDARGPVVDAVHGGDVGQQCLRGADVGGGFVPPDVLFSGLQGQPIAVAIVDVPSDHTMTYSRLAALAEEHLL